MPDTKPNEEKLVASLVNLPRHKVDLLSTTGEHGVEFILRKIHYKAVDNVRATEIRLFSAEASDLCHAIWKELGVQGKQGADDSNGGKS